MEMLRAYLGLCLCALKDDEHSGEATTVYIPSSKRRIVPIIDLVDLQHRPSSGVESGEEQHKNDNDKDNDNESTCAYTFNKGVLKRRGIVMSIVNTVHGVATLMGSTLIA